MRVYKKLKSTPTSSLPASSSEKRSEGKEPKPSFLPKLSLCGKSKPKRHNERPAMLLGTLNLYHTPPSSHLPCRFQSLMRPHIQNIVLLTFGCQGFPPLLYLSNSSRAFAMTCLSHASCSFFLSVSCLVTSLSLLGCLAVGFCSVFGGGGKSFSRAALIWRSSLPFNASKSSRTVVCLGATKKLRR